MWSGTAGAGPLSVLAARQQQQQQQQQEQEQQRLQPQQPLQQLLLPEQPPPAPATPRRPRTGGAHIARSFLEDLSAEGPAGSPSPLSRAAAELARAAKASEDHDPVPWRVAGAKSLAEEHDPVARRASGGRRLPAAMPAAEEHEPGPRKAQPATPSALEEHILGLFEKERSQLREQFDKACRELTAQQSVLFESFESRLGDVVQEASARAAATASASAGAGRRDISAAVERAEAGAAAAAADAEALRAEVEALRQEQHRTAEDLRARLAEAAAQAAGRRGAEEVAAAAEAATAAAAAAAARADALGEQVEALRQDQRRLVEDACARVAAAQLVAGATARAGQPSAEAVAATAERAERAAAAAAAAAETLQLDLEAVRGKQLRLAEDHDGLRALLDGQRTACDELAAVVQRDCAAASIWQQEAAGRTDEALRRVLELESAWGAERAAREGLLHNMDRLQGQKVPEMDAALAAVEERLLLLEQVPATPPAQGGAGDQEATSTEQEALESIRQEVAERAGEAQRRALELERRWAAEHGAQEERARSQQATLEQEASDLRAALAALQERLDALELDRAGAAASAMHGLPAEDEDDDEEREKLLAQLGAQRAMLAELAEVVQEESAAMRGLQQEAADRADEASRRAAALEAAWEADRSAREDWASGFEQRHSRQVADVHAALDALRERLGAAAQAAASPTSGAAALVESPSSGGGDEPTLAERLSKVEAATRSCARRSNILADELRSSADEVRAEMQRLRDGLAAVARRTSADSAGRPSSGAGEEGVGEEVPAHATLATRVDKLEDALRQHALAAAAARAEAEAGAEARQVLEEEVRARLAEMRAALDEDPAPGRDLPVTGGRETNKEAAEDLHSGRCELADELSRRVAGAERQLEEQRDEIAGARRLAEAVEGQLAAQGAELQERLASLEGQAHRQAQALEAVEQRLAARSDWESAGTQGRPGASSPRTAAAQADLTARAAGVEAALAALSGRVQAQAEADAARNALAAAMEKMGTLLGAHDHYARQQEALEAACGGLRTALLGVAQQLEDERRARAADMQDLRNSLLRLHAAAATAPHRSPAAGTLGAPADGAPAPPRPAATLTIPTPSSSSSPALQSELARILEARRRIAEGLAGTPRGVGPRGQPPQSHRSGSRRPSATDPAPTPAPGADVQAEGREREDDPAPSESNSGSEEEDEEEEEEAPDADLPPSDREYFLNVVRRTTLQLSGAPLPPLSTIPPGQHLLPTNLPRPSAALTAAVAAALVPPSPRAARGGSRASSRKASKEAAPPRAPSKECAVVVRAALGKPPSDAPPRAPPPTEQQLRVLVIRQALLGRTEPLKVGMALHLWEKEHLGIIHRDRGLVMGSMAMGPTSSSRGVAMGATSSGRGGTMAMGATNSGRGMAMCATSSGRRGMRIVTALTPAAVVLAAARHARQQRLVEVVRQCLASGGHRLSGSGAADADPAPIAPPFATPPPEAEA